MAEIPFEPYTGQSKLRFWCQKVLPLVYDDSLSYYELLGKVVEYLNNTITDVSACEDNITALRDAFVQLQDYVNEQLEDFAPEVERIIDEMIDNGEFGEIVTDAVNGIIAGEYSTTQGYAQFDYVLKDGKLYCATASTSGEWDSTKWRETTVGADMQLLNQRVYNLNAGQVAFVESATYSNNTVGKKLKDLDYFDDNLNAGQVGYNSESMYNNTTVGKELQDLKGSLNSWKGKKIVWYGTSISAGGYIGKTNPNAIPQKIGAKIGANVINEAIGSSCVHCKQSSMYNASTNPYAFFSNKFEMASRCLSNSNTELQWIIDHFTFFSNAPASLSDELKAQILSNGYQSKIDPYLTASTFPDLFVFEHGFNDVINGDLKATQDLDYVNDEGVHLYSYRSAMDFLITRILNYNYKAKIVIIGNYNAYGPSGTKSGDVYRMQEEVAEKYNIPLLKLWDLIGWTDQASVSVNGTTKTVIQAWLPDGVHPHSDTSGAATAKYVDIVANWLNNLKV